MANLSVTEYHAMGRDPYGLPLPAGDEPAHIRQNVVFADVAAASAPFDSRTNFIRVSTDADARIRIDADATASDADSLIAAGQTEYFAVKVGHRISVIAV